MDIVCSTDNNYVQHCCCMLVSFFENNKEGRHSVHVLSEGLEPNLLNQIKDIVTSYNGCFFYYMIDSDCLKCCPIKTTDHLSIATYYRLLIAVLLPHEIKRVLYLDCDIVVDAPLKELWNTSLTEYALAAVEELGSSAPDVYERLEYDAKYGYFNAGVLLVNLEYWREKGLTELFFRYMSLHADKLKAHDQDVLNALLHDKCLHVSPKWNVEEAFYHYYMIKKWRKRDKDEMISVLFQPFILHYSWKPKPWEELCSHPFRLKYFKYLNKTAIFADKQLSFAERLLAHYDKWYLKMLVRLGIKGHRFYKLE